MKTCAKCKLEKPFKDFSKKGSGLHAYCKQCVRVYFAHYYEKNRKSQCTRKFIRQKGERQAILDFILWLKSVPCIDCGNTYNTWQMQFDHVRGEKKFNLGAIPGKDTTFDMVVDEVLKCEIVCANCHAHRTYMRSNARV